MNEIEVYKDSEPLKAEIEPIGADPPIPPDPTPGDWSQYLYPMRVEENRACQRYPAVAGRSWLGWYEGRQFHQTAAWILNISAGGCLVVADKTTPVDRSLWLRLDDPGVPNWAEVRVVGQQSGSGGILASRLVFRGTCPYDMMKAVAFSSSAKPTAKPEPSRSWSFNSW
jgi:hypothetical protein